VLALDAVCAGFRPITVPGLPPTNYLSVRGVSLHSFTRGGFPTIAYAPICLFIGVEGGMVLLWMANQSAGRRATLALRFKFRYNPCLSRGVQGAAMAGG